MKKIAVIVVTYNRLDCLRKWFSCFEELECVDNYVYIPYIIDNCSTDGTDLYISSLRESHKEIQYVRLSENTGGAGGFYEGIRIAREESNDFIWGMDDDAFPHTDSLRVLIRMYEKLKSLKGTEVCLCSNSTDDHDFPEKQNYKIVPGWMFVGFFMPLKVVQEIDLPRKDFFIYRDDTEYSQRVRKKYEIYRIENSVIDHSVGGVPRYRKKILGKTVSFYKLADWKLYYFLRNEILMYSPNEIAYYKSIYHGLRTIVQLAILNPSQVRVCIKAIADGILRKSGKRMGP